MFEIQELFKMCSQIETEGEYTTNFKWVGHVKMFDIEIRKVGEKEIIFSVAAYLNHQLFNFDKIVEELGTFIKPVVKEIKEPPMLGVVIENYEIDWDSPVIQEAMNEYQAKKPIMLVDVTEEMIKEPFVYCRKHGFFEVGDYNHQLFMAWLYAVEAVGPHSAIEHVYDLSHDTSEAVERFLKNYDGACFLSSMGCGEWGKIQTYKDRSEFGSLEIIKFLANMEKVDCI